MRIRGSERSPRPGPSQRLDVEDDAHLWINRGDVDSLAGLQEDGPTGIGEPGREPAPVPVSTAPIRETLTNIRGMRNPACWLDLLIIRDL
jgi:hypothetical protein